MSNRLPNFLPHLAHKHCLAKNHVKDVYGSSEELTVIEPLCGSMLRKIEPVLAVATTNEELVALKRAQELLSD